jgi:hypothetical protein
VDLTTITTFLSQYGTWGILLAGVLTLTSDKWLPWLKGKFSSTASTPAVVGPSDDADVTDVAGLHLLQARAKRSGCPKFQAAVRDVELCFFNHVDPQAMEAAK